VIALPLQYGNLAVAAEVAGWEANFRGRLLEAELFLKGTGTGAGNTDVDVNKAGVTILAAPGLRIASAASTKRVRAKPTVGVSGHPNGVPFNVGDYFSVDVDAIPATTASADGTVYLHIAAVDV
jgi:hypothetical protein